MSARVDLACTVCELEFVVSVEAYKARSGIVHCPGCGSTDLVLLHSDEGMASELSEDAVA